MIHRHLLKLKIKGLVTHIRFSHPDLYLKWRTVPNAVMGFQCAICGFCYSTDNELHNHQRKEGACKRNLDQLTVSQISVQRSWIRVLKLTLPVVFWRSINRKANFITLTSNLTSCYSVRAWVNVFQEQHSFLCLHEPLNDPDSNPKTSWNDYNSSSWYISWIDFFFSRKIIPTIGRRNVRRDACQPEERKISNTGWISLQNLSEWSKFSNFWLVECTHEERPREGVHSLSDNENWSD